MQEKVHMSLFQLPLVEQQSNVWSVNLCNVANVDGMNTKLLFSNF